MLLIDSSVSGWSSPRTRRRASRASRQYGSASSYLPIAWSSSPMLLIDSSVSGWSSPRTRRRVSRDAACKGIARSYRPIFRYVSATVCSRSARTSGWSAKSLWIVSTARASTYSSTTFSARLVALTSPMSRSNGAKDVSTSCGVKSSFCSSPLPMPSRSAWMIPRPIVSASMSLSMDCWNSVTVSRVSRASSASLRALACFCSAATASRRSPSARVYITLIQTPKPLISRNNTTTKQKGALCREISFWN